MRVNQGAVIRAIVKKDLQAEIRSRELMGTMLLFALLSIIIFSFALELDRIAREEAVSGVLWVTIAFASILGLNRSMALEREQNNIDALLIAPIDRSSIFIGKLIGNYVFTVLVGLMMLPIMSIIYNYSLINPWLILILLLGTLGLIVVGTFLSAMTIQTRSRETLLPIAMLPIVLPVILAAVRVSTAIIQEKASADWLSWIAILILIDFVYFLLCYVMFPFVVEE